MRSQTQRTLLIGFLASIALCGLVGVYSLLLGTFGEFQAKVLGTTAVVAAASILGLASAIPWERRRYHPVGPAGLCSVAIALVLVLVAIWADMSGWQGEEDFFRLMGTACVAAIALPHAGLISLAALRPQYEWVRRATLVAIFVVSVQAIGTIWLEPDEEVWIRLMGIMAIGVTCGTVATPILHRVSRIQAREAVRTVELRVQITCPRCHLAQQLAVGRSRCTDCGLRFSIEIEEESCPKCGYPLYQLTSAVCPECGTAILPPRNEMRS